MKSHEYHLMLARLGKKYLPQSHYVTDLYDCWDKLAKECIVVVTEFSPRMWFSTVEISLHDILHKEENLADLMEFKHEVAFAILDQSVNAAWSNEVIPAEVPAGE